MHRIPSTLTLGFLLTLAGCPSDDSPPAGSESSSSSAGSSTTMTMPTTTMPSGVDTTAAQSTGEPDPSTGDPGTTTGEPDPTTGEPVETEGSSSSGGQSMACAPDPADDDCAACIKESCCPQLEVCLADGDATTGCVCFQECVQAGGDPLMECPGDCDVDPFDMMSPTGQIGACTLGNCNICL